MNRRGFLKGIAGLGAVVVAPAIVRSTSLDLYVPSETLVFDKKNFDPVISEEDFLVCTSSGPSVANSFDHILGSPRNSGTSSALCDSAPYWGVPTGAKFGSHSFNDIQSSFHERFHELARQHRREMDFVEHSRRRSSELLSLPSINFSSALRQREAQLKKKQIEFINSHQLAKSAKRNES